MKVVVCDPVCAQPFGHNAPALKLFGESMRKNFDDVVMACSSYLPKELVEYYKFDAIFDFYYHDYIDLPGRSYKESVIFAKRWGGYADPLEAVATADADKLLARYNLTDKDAILFPSVDFYGAIGLFNALATKSEHKRPRVFLRFIGVMESSSKFYRDPLAELTWRIKDALKAGFSLSITAETPRLSDDLSERFGIDVGVTPYPDIHQPLPYPHIGSFNVYCPGSARPDKGFFELLEIFTEIRKKDPELSIRFVTQSLGRRDAAHFQNYISQLYALPGVRLLPSVISDEQMRVEFQNSSMVLLPYDRQIYALRGSAGMMEAATYGRPLVTYSGSAFSEQVSWYRLGAVVNTRAEIIKVILELARQSRTDHERRALRGRRRFLSDVEQAYRHWLMVNS